MIRLLGSLRHAAPALCLTLAAACSAADSPPAIPGPGEGQIRVATWNIRFFPEPPSDEGPGTDVRRTGEILAGLDADLIAVQEIADPAVLEELLAGVNAELAAQATSTGGTRVRHYVSRLADSGGHGGQFVGFVYDTLALELTGVRTLWSLQMTPDLRPALYGWARSRRGGLDFQVVTVHNDSGTDDRDYQNRLRFLDSLDDELAGRWAADADIIVLGDLNTMGREAGEGLPRISADAEIAGLDRRLAEMDLRRVQSDPSCTEYYRGRGTRLDHVLVSTRSALGATDLEASVFGYCGENECRRLDARRMPYDYARVSDHCPVVVDLEDVDRD